MLCLDEAELLQIAIKKAYQRRGHASYLLQFAFSEMQKNAIKKIFLEVRASNTVAQAFYERLGFEKIAIRRHYYLTSNGREDAWIYCLENFIACQQGF
jgi:ribosomal-protein-alanine N-acetyltransferase